MGSARPGFLLLCLLAALAQAAPGHAQQRPTETVLKEARDEVAAGRQPEALRLLEAQLTANPRDVDARLLYGLVLSWSGRYDDARRELEQVLKQSPTYTDARVALANVEWWSGQYDRLDRVASEGLKQQPDDARWLIYRARALDGLGQPRQARRVVDTVLSGEPGNVTARALGEQLDAKLRPWFAQLSHTVDWFDDDRATWKETAATMGGMTPVGTVLTRVSYSERFGLSDTQLEFEAYPRFRPGTYGYINLGASFDKVLYPRSRVGLELYQSLGGGFEGSLGWRRLDFANATNIYVGTLTKYAGNWMLTGRAYFIPQEPSDSSSYHGLVRRYFGSDGTSFVGMGYSHGFSREEIRNLADLLTLDSDTVRAEFDARLGGRLRAAASGSTSRQELAFGPLRQNTVSASLRVIF
jgi:YaiO family outer membrane protein